MESEYYRRYSPVFRDWIIEEECGETTYGKLFLILNSKTGAVALLEAVSVPFDAADIAALAECMSEEQVKNFLCTVANELARRAAYTSSFGNRVMPCDEVSVVERSDGIGFDVLLRMPRSEQLSVAAQREHFLRKRKLEMGLYICSALTKCASEGITHGDITPRDIFCMADGSFSLAHFGFAELFAVNEVKKSGAEAPSFSSDADVAALADILFRLFEADGDNDVKDALAPFCQPNGGRSLAELKSTLAHLSAKPDAPASPPPPPAQVSQKPVTNGGFGGTIPRSPAEDGSRFKFDPGQPPRVEPNKSLKAQNSKRNTVLLAIIIPVALAIIGTAVTVAVVLVKREMNKGAQVDLFTSDSFETTTVDGIEPYDYEFDVTEPMEEVASEAIVWAEPKIEALVRQLIGKTSGDITIEELDGYESLAIFGEAMMLEEYSEFSSFIEPGDADYSAFSVNGSSIEYPLGSIRNFADLSNFRNLRHLTICFNSGVENLPVSELVTLILCYDNISDISFL